MLPISSDASAAAISAALLQLDVPAAEAALAGVEAHRQTLLLSTSDDAPILRAESAITSARITRDRAAAMHEELSRRLVEAKQRERRAAIQAQYDEAVRMADDLEQQLRRSYVAAAAQLIALAEAEALSDDAVAKINQLLLEEDTDLLAIRPAGDRIWAEYHDVVRLKSVLSLPPVGDFPGHGAGAELLTKEKAWAIGDTHRGPVVPAHSYV